MATRRPSIPVVQSVDRNLKEFCDAVRENVERMQGVRGDARERAVTLGDLEAMGIDISGALASRGGQVGKSTTQSTITAITTDTNALAREIYNTSLFRELVSSMDDPARFQWVPDQLRRELVASIAEEASKRGTDIRSVQQIVSTAVEDFASKLDEITASFAGTAAGVRELSFAYANADRAIAAKVTTVEARITGVAVDPALILGVGGVVGGAAFANLAALKTAIPTGTLGKYYKVANPVSGQQDVLYKWNGSAYEVAGQGLMAGVEQIMRASADRTTGSEAQYTLKVTAGKAIAGFDISATSNAAGATTSAAVFQVDNFGVVPSTYVNNGPIDVRYAPFGVDATGIYLNGAVRINATGMRLDAIEPSITFIGSFATAPGATGRVKNQVYANTTDKKSYIWTVPGGWVEFIPPGVNGINGKRGGVDIAYTVTGLASWSDSYAVAAIAALVGGLPVATDRVTLRNSDTNPTFIETRYWDGLSPGAWLAVGVVIDGNLLVRGTVTSDKIGSNVLTAVNINTSGTIKATGTAVSTFNWLGSEINTSAELSIAATDASKWRAGAVGYVPTAGGSVGAWGLIGIHNPGAAANYQVSGGVVGITDTGTGVYGFASGSGSGLTGRNIGTGPALTLNGNAIIHWESAVGSTVTVAKISGDAETYLDGAGNWTNPIDVDTVRVTVDPGGGTSILGYVGLQRVGGGSTIRIPVYAIV